MRLESFLPKDARCSLSLPVGSEILNSEQLWNSILEELGIKRLRCRIGRIGKQVSSVWSVLYPLPGHCLKPSALYTSQAKLDKRLRQWSNLVLWPDEGRALRACSTEAHSPYPCSSKDPRLARYYKVGTGEAFPCGPPCSSPIICFFSDYFLA